MQLPSLLSRATFVLIATVCSTLSQAQTGTVLVRHAPALGGNVDGSVQQMTAEGTTLNGGASVTGDLLVPGTPTIRLNGNPNYGGTLDGSGAASPANYQVTLNGNTTLRHVVRRTDAVALPAVTAPPQPAGTRSVTIASAGDSPGSFSTLRNLTLNGNVGQFAIPPGTYGDFTANGGSGFTLGVAGATTPAVYNFQHLTFNGQAQLQVVGPVVVALANGFAVNGSLGAAPTPAWLALNIYSGPLTLNGGSSFYGYVTAPNSTVTIGGNSQFVGGLACDRLTVNGNGLLRLAATTTNAPPAVSLVAPVSGTVVTAPGTIALQATASDSDGGIAKVEFFRSDSATPLATVTTPPYQFTWSNVAAGTYTLTARATDNAGATATSASSTIIVNAPPGSVAITSPANNAVFRAPSDITFQATATDADGTIARVEFFSGATFLGEATAAPYQFTWTAVPAGSYSVTAVATDNLVARTSSAAVGVVVDAPPTVTLTAPGAGATFTAPATITAQVTASDPDGSIAKVELFNGSTLVGETSVAPYQIVWSGVGTGAYSLTAVATDNLGLKTTSAAVSIQVVAPNSPPTVALTSPANGTVFTAPASFQLAATASDSDGTVAKVEFFSDQSAQPIGEVTTAPYQLSVANLAAGTYTFTARATDNQGAPATSAGVTVIVNAPPTVALTAPANNAVTAAPGSVTLKANASDSDGTIASVEFFNGSASLGTVTAPPYQFLWSNVAAGTYSLTAKATDNRGATTTSAAVTLVVDTLPTVAVATVPAAQSVFDAPATITLSASASDSDGTIAKVEFFANGNLLGEVTTAPYQFTWSAMPAGVYAVTAKATDDRGLSQTSAPISLTVNVPPVVALTAPANNAGFVAPAGFTLAADATDSDGTIAQVEFFDGTTSLGVSATAPYQLPVANLAAGPHVFTAKATDNIGSVATSAAVTVLVDAPPTITLTAPANNATFVAPANVTLTANATDGDGTVAKVEFFQGTTKLGETTTPSTPPATFTFTLPSALSAGSYSFTARATDNRGATADSNTRTITVVTNQPPAVSLTAPASGAQFIAPASITVTAQASDTDGAVAKVEFFANATPIGETLAAPYTIAWNGVGVGSYTLTARATDDLGAQTTSSAVTITVNANQAPTTTLNPPAGGTTFAAPANVSFSVTANDSDGTVAKVEIYRGNTLVATLTAPSSPSTYTFSETTPLRAGTYVYFARTTDNRGATSDSAPLTITVRASLPYLADFEAAEGYTLGALAGQQGWTAAPDGALVTDQAFFSGSRSAVLPPGVPPVQLTQTFAALAGQNIIFVDFFAKPVADADVAVATTFDIESSRVAFVLANGQGTLNVFDGDGVGGGQWVAKNFNAPLDASNQTQSWVRLTARLDFAHKTWDLYANGQMVAADLKFRDNTRTYLSTFSVRGHTAANSRLDYLFAAATNPLFADVNNNGIDDAWETAHGLSLAVDSRYDDPDGDGLTNLQEYMAGSDPADYFNGSVPVIASLVTGGRPGAQGLVAVKLTRASDSAALVNAPVTLAVTTGASQISTTAGGSLTTQIAVRTDAQGIARGYLVFPAGVGSDVLVAGARSGTQTTSLSIPVAAPIVPPSTAGMRLWLKADTGVTTDGSGGISSWSDQSGRGNNAMQGTASQRPTVTSSAINGLPVVSFSAPGSQYFTLPNVMSGATEGEIMMVLRAGTTLPVQHASPWSFGTDSGSQYPANGPATAGQIWDDFGSNAQHNVGVPAQSITTFQIYDASAKTGDWKARMNGALQFATTSNTVSFSSTPLMGRLINNPSFFFTGDLAEMIVFDHALTAAERDSVGTYLAQKYALGSAPAPATNLTASAISSTQISLEWSGSLTGTTYTIERQTGGGDFAVVAEVVESSSYLDTGLTAGTTFSYRVRAKSYAGISGYSNVATAATLAAGATDLPTTGVRLWLRADAGVVGSTRVASWLDQSSNHADATQSTVTSQPAWVASAVNGRPVVRFDGSTFYNLPNFMNGVTAGEIFAVVKAASATPGSHLGLWRIGNGDTFYPLQDGGIQESFGSTQAYVGGKPTQSVDQFRVYNVSATAGDWSSRIDGVPYLHVNGNTVGFRSDPQLGASGSLKFSGDIAEVMIYDHVLTDAEREVVGNYLNLRYGLVAAAPNTPTSLTATAISITQVSLTWQADLPTASVIYEIERQTGSGGFAKVAEVSLALGYIDGSAAPGTQYTYRVRARNAAGRSGYSNTASAATLHFGAPAMPLAGMRLWLKADSVLSASRVVTWPDQSPARNDAVQYDTTRQPTVVAGVANGRPVVRFSPSSYLNLPNIMAAATSGEVFAVLKVATQTPSDERGLWRLGGGDTFYPRHEGSIQESFGSASAYTSAVLPAHTLDQFHLYNVSAQSGLWVSRLNAAQNSAVAGNVVNFTSDVKLGTSGGKYFDGDIAEIIIYDHVLSDVERETVGAYLNGKYAFTAATVFANARDLNEDGIADGIGLQLGIDPTNLDTDGDGVPNWLEILMGTDPFNADTDGDGVPDGQDAFPLDPTRWLPLAPTAGDTTPPVITLTKPADAVPQP